MAKNFLTAVIVFLLVCTSSSAQNTNPWPSTGDIGIGTVSPNAPLHVNGGSTMTAGWNRTSVLQATFPVQVFSSNSTKWAGVGYDYSTAMRFWLNASSNDVTSGTLGMSLLNNGNLGIGAFTPVSKLDVAGNIRLGDHMDNNWRFIGKGSAGNDINGTYSNWIGFQSTDTQDYLTFGTHLSGVGGGERMRIDAVGNVGIGISSPVSPLHVNGGIVMTGGWNKTSVLQAVYPVQLFNSNNSKWAGIGYDYGHAMRFWVNGTSDDITSTAIPALNIMNNGNVVIGKTNQVNTSYKLDVDGTARANEIKVNSTGADFVFEDDYKLRSLAETEAFIKANKHLPEIAPAETMKREGIELGEMNMKLLQKIEELTLHLINLNKTVEAQNAKVADQEKRLSKLNCH